MSARNVSADSSDRYIYADNAATTPLSSHALEAMMPYLTTTFGNPSGIHRVAREAAEALGDARVRVASALAAASPSEVYFTSGGSESDTWVLTGAVRRFWDLYGPGARPRIITSAVEHHAILHTCDALEREGVEIIKLNVDHEGRVSPDELEACMRRAESHPGDRACPPAALVSIILANNEVGTIQDIEHLAEVAHDHHVPFHTDAVQAVGHIPVDVQALGVDALSLSAHKFHGPRGVGALYLKDGFSIPPLVMGGAQERGERAGTENLAGIAGLACAIEDAQAGLAGRGERLAHMRGILTDAIVGSTAATIATGVDDRNEDWGAAAPLRLPSIASFVCRDVDGELLVVLLDHAGIAAATGSACSTGSTDPSHVIRALGYTDPAWNRGTLRLSLADDITREDLDILCERVPRAIERARQLSAPVASI